MSVHAAKGLEFPVVAVPELSRDAQGDTGPLVLEKHGCGARLALSLRGGDSSKAEERRSRWASDARERARARDVEEEKRLFYVACTRARDVLILSGAGDLSKPPGDNALGWLRLAVKFDLQAPGAMEVGGAPIRFAYLDGSAEPAPAPLPREGGTEPATCYGPEDTPVREEAAQERPATPPEVSYSSMRLYESCGLRYFAEKVARIGDARPQDAHDPLRFGEAVHTALRLVGPAATPPPAARLDAIARRSRLTAVETDRLRDACGGFLLSHACQEAHATGEPAHEVPFAVPLEGATLVGKMDLLADTRCGALVVDYKTGRDALRDGAAEGYRAQADCYALATLTGGAAAAEVVFVGIETGEGGPPREVRFTYSCEDRPRLHAEASARAMALSTGPYEPLEAYAPHVCDSCPAARAICPLTLPGRAPKGP
jgi:ATP-dependent helicase/nuclease subunit A